MEKKINKNNTYNAFKIIIFFVAILLAIGFLFLNPVTTPPDEIAHLAYPRYILANQSLPSFTSPEDSWESHQPPLYYLTSLPLILLGERSSMEAQITVNRAASLLFFALYLISLHFFLLKFFKKSFQTQVAGLILGLLPSILYIATSYANDIAAVSFCMAILASWAYNRTDTNYLKTIAFGLLLGLTLLTKVHAYPIILVFFLWFAIKKPLLHTIVMVGTMISISSWWFIRNSVVVGDFFGISNTFQLWQGQDTGINSLLSLTKLFGKLGQGLIGVFAKNSLALSPWLYIISLMMIGGLLVLSFKPKPILKTERWALWGSVVCMIGFIVWQSSKFYQPQGRYLLPSYPALLALMLLGFENMAKRWKPIALACIGGCLFLLSVFSLQTLLHYKQQPVPSFKGPREINGLTLGWIGSQRGSNNEALTFYNNKPFSTLADLRLLSEKKPRILIETDSERPLMLKLRWKTLGDNRFSEKHELTKTFSNSTVFFLPVGNPTLIQDFELRVLEGDYPQKITAFTIQTD